jgi:hypothetical protein
LPSGAFAANTTVGVLFSISPTHSMHSLFSAFGHSARAHTIAFSRASTSLPDSRIDCVAS